MHIKKLLLPMLLATTCGTRTYPDGEQPADMGPLVAHTWQVLAAGQGTPPSPLRLLLALGAALDVAITPAAPVAVEGTAVQQVQAVVPGCTGLVGIAPGTATLVAAGPAGPVAKLAITVQPATQGVCRVAPGVLAPGGGLVPGTTAEAWLELDVPGRWPRPLQVQATGAAGVVLGPCPTTGPAFGPGCWLLRQQATAPAAFTATDGTETFPVLFREKVLANEDPTN